MENMYDDNYESYDPTFEELNNAFFEDSSEELGFAASEQEDEYGSPFGEDDSSAYSTEVYDGEPYWPIGDGSVETASSIAVSSPNIGETCGSIGLSDHAIGDGSIETASSIAMSSPNIGDGGETCGSVGISQRTFVYNPSFQAKEDMLPYEQKENFDMDNGTKDPFGFYAARFNGGELSTDDFIEKPFLPDNFTEEQLQDACNQMCDVLGIKHLPVFVTDTVPNAQHSTLVGPFRFTLVDDTLSFNPNYTQECVEYLGSTDIVLSDAAHEVGHALASKYCGKLSTYTNEKVADFISGFLNCKMGVDVDVARQWFQWQYDPDGINNYPVSEERWDIESAGYYFGKLASAEDLKSALQDPDFLKLIMEYKNENLVPLSFEQWGKMHLEGCGYTDTARNMFDKIQKYLLIKRY